MSKQLVEKLRKGREIRIEVGKFVFIGMRPTDLEMLGINRLENEAQARRVLEQVIGWEGVVGDDIAGGADMDAVKFDRDLWLSWAADRTEFWAPIAEAVFGAYAKHVGAEADAAKN